MKAVGGPPFPYYVCVVQMPAAQLSYPGNDTYYGVDGIDPVNDYNASQVCVTQMPAAQWSYPAIGACYAAGDSEPVNDFHAAQPPLVPPEMITLADAAPTHLRSTHSEVLQGKVWCLARDATGCRSVQQALEDAECDEDRLLLASGLSTHVWEALKCPNGNHVLQKCISTMRPADSAFVIDELMQVRGGAARAARHRYGCRVLQRLFEHCAPGQLAGIAEDLLAEAVPLCRHIYAKYVMQHLLEHGTEAHVARLVRVLTEHAAAMCTDGAGCAVLAKALESGNPDAQAALAQAILQEHALVVDMASSRHGNLVARLALKLARGSLRQEALGKLAGEHEKLKSSRYGRVLDGFVWKSITDDK